MRISVANDHRGVELKRAIIAKLESLGHQVCDDGASGSESVDYPDFASLVACKVSDGAIDRGVLICGTGIGMAIAANKYPGVRAAPCSDEVTAEISRRHNDLNILCLSADLLSARVAERMVELAAQQPGFLGAESARDAEGFGITVSYWATEEAIVSWRRHAEHRAAQEQGRAQWYAHFEVRVARVERAWGKPA